MDAQASSVGDQGSGGVIQREANQTESFSVLDTWAPMKQQDGRRKETSEAQEGCQDKYSGVIMSCTI